MKKIFSIIAITALFLISCQKTGDPKKVDYIITGLADTYEVLYFDEEGKSVSEKVTPEGISYRWIKTYSMDQGNPVYLYLKFKEDISSSMNFSMGILIDGKYAYQAKYYEKTKGDTIFEVKRSGIVPYD